MRILMAALFFAVCSGVVAVLTLPPPGWPLWGNYETATRVQIAALAVAPLSILVTIFAIASGLAELNEAFPKQRLEVEAINDTDDWDYSPVCRLRLVCTTESAIVTAWRVEVSLVGQDGRVKWHDPAHSKARVPPGWTYTQIEDETSYLYAWTHVSSSPLFPGVSVQCPTVTAAAVTAGDSWVVRWWTDRAQSERLVLLAPPTP